MSQLTIQQVDQEILRLKNILDKLETDCANAITLGHVTNVARIEKRVRKARHELRQLTEDRAQLMKYIIVL